MNGAHPRLKSEESVVCAATRGLSVFDIRTEFVRSPKVISLDFRKESSDGGDEGVHAGVFLGGSHGCELLDPVGRWICLTGEPREIGGVAVRTFGCGGVGCEGVGTCPSPCEGRGASSEQRGCRRPQLNHNRWPRATRYGEGVRGGLPQPLRGVGRGVEGGIFAGPGDHCMK